MDHLVKLIPSFQYPSIGIRFITNYIGYGFMKREVYREVDNIFSPRNRFDIINGVTQTVRDLFARN